MKYVIEPVAMPGVDKEIHSLSGLVMLIMLFYDYYIFLLDLIESVLLQFLKGLA